MSSAKAHGDPGSLPEGADRTGWYQEDPCMWAGLYGSMSLFLALEQARLLGEEYDGDSSEEQ